MAPASMNGVVYDDIMQMRVNANSCMIYWSIDAWMRKGMDVRIYGGFLLCLWPRQAQQR